AGSSRPCPASPPIVSGWGPRPDRPLTAGTCSVIELSRPGGKCEILVGLWRSMPIKTLSTIPLIHPTAEVRDCRLGAYTEVGARTRLLEVAFGDYSYVVNDSEGAYTRFGRFCSIAAMARINPGNHPMARATQSHMTYRASAYFPGERDEEEFFAWRRAALVVIGHDVWIGHGAIVLPGRTVGTGA